MFTRADKFALPYRLVWILFLVHTRLLHSSQKCCLRYFIKRAGKTPVLERPINASNDKRSELRFCSKSNAPVNWNPPPKTPGKYGALMGVTKGFGTFLCPRGWRICCFLLHQFCPWDGGLVRFWHSWTSEDWGEWVVSMCFLIPKGSFKMDDIKVLCWFMFFPIKLRAQELFIIVLKSIKMK